MTNREIAETLLRACDVLDEAIDLFSKILESKKRELAEGKAEVYAGTQNQWSREFFDLAVEAFFVPELLEIKRLIGRLRRLKRRVAFHLEEKNTGLSETQIEEARSRPIEEVVVNHGNIRLRRSGPRFLAVCPFHQEKTPSLTLYLDTNSWYCFGCGKGGDTIDFVRQIGGLTFYEAVKLLL